MAEWRAGRGSRYELPWRFEFERAVGRTKKGLVGSTGHRSSFVGVRHSSPSSETVDETSDAVSINILACSRLPELREEPPLIGFAQTPKIMGEEAPDCHGVLRRLALPIRPICFHTHATRHLFGTREAPRVHFRSIWGSSRHKHRRNPPQGRNQRA